MTVLSKLIAKEQDGVGYVTYVFECLDKEDIVRLDSKYIMCTRFPNWDHRSINIDEIGYLNFIEIRAGIDKWFDGANMVPYNYNNIQFIKFISKPRDKSNVYIM